MLETEEAKHEFEAWKLEQEQKNANKAKNEAMPKWASPRIFYVQLEGKLK